MSVLERIVISMYIALTLLVNVLDVNKSSAARHVVLERMVIQGVEASDHTRVYLQANYTCRISPAFQVLIGPAEAGVQSDASHTRH
jgi:hypothetical protein